MSEPLVEGTAAGALKNGWKHVRKEDLRDGSALDVDPPFAAFDVVHRCDYEALVAEREALQRRLRRIADETRDHPGLGLIHHLALGTHDESLARAEAGRVGVLEAALRDAEPLIANEPPGYTAAMYAEDVRRRVRAVLAGGEAGRMVPTVGGERPARGPHDYGETPLAGGEAGPNYAVADAELAAGLTKPLDVVLAEIDAEEAAGGEAGPRYDREKRQWVPQCPHGDVCTGCDALGYCTRVEGGEAGGQGPKPARPPLDPSNRSC